MGGKNNQAQRTKDNVRPSSSGRSAELLGNNIKIKFSGFSGIKETGFVRSAFSLPTAEDSQLGMNHSLHMSFKAMGKKDPTTKLKAITAFTQNIMQSEPAAVKLVIQVWVRYFAILANDSRHKIREATHKAHFEILKKTGKAIVPYLKQIIAVWFISQKDTYAPAATLARCSFEFLVSENIMEKLIIMNSEGIVTFISNNLKAPPPTPADIQQENILEDLEDKYNRLVISSLLGYSLFLNKIQRENMTKVQKFNEHLLGAECFWEFSKHKNVAIRASWYEALTVLFKKVPLLLEKKKSSVLSATLGNLDETDPVVLPLVWQNVLLTVTSIKEWWTEVKINEEFLPKLWKLLIDGGSGNAVVIYPNLLPLLPNLKPIVDKTTFYDNFFENLCLGMKQTSVASSKKESTAIHTALIECLKYVIMENGEDDLFCRKLILEYLMKTIEYCLEDTQCSYRSIFSQTASLTHYWCRNKTDGNKYCSYLNTFWSSLEIVFRRVLMSTSSLDSDKILCSSERQIEFVKSLKLTAKSKKVQFDVSFPYDHDNYYDDDIHNAGYDPPILDEFFDVRSHPDDNFFTSVTNLILKIGETFVRLISERESKALLDNLLVLIREIDARTFLVHINKEVCLMENDDVAGVFRELLQKWLRCENLRSKSLVELCFLTFGHVEDAEKQTVFDSIVEVPNEEYIGWCSERALSSPYNKDPIVQKWLMDDKITDFLVNAVEMKIANECPPHMSALLRLAVTGNDNGDVYISEQALSRIVEKLKLPLLDPEDYLESLDACASLASLVASVVYSEKNLLKFSDGLLLALINFDSRVLEKEHLSENTRSAVRSSWMDALGRLLAGLSVEEKKDIIDNIVNIVHTELQKDLQEASLKSLEIVLCNLCIKILDKYEPHSRTLSERLFNNSFVKEWVKKVEDVCKIVSYLNGNLTSCYDEFLLTSDVDVNDRDLVTFFAWMVLRVRVLFRHYCWTHPTSPKDAYQEKLEKMFEDAGPECAYSEVEETEDDASRYLDSENLYWIMKILYEKRLCECFLLSCVSVRFMNKLESSLSQLAAPDYHLKTVMKRMLYSESWIWSQTIYAENYRYEYFVEGATSNDKLAVLHLTQSYGESLDFDRVSYAFDDVGRVIVLRSLAGCAEIDVQIAEVMSKLEDFRNADVARFNLTCERSKIDWQSYQMILEVARLFTALVKHQFDSLSRKYIDLILISLGEWIQSLVRCYKWEMMKPMIIAVIRLYQAVSDKMKELKSNGSNVALTKEWDDVFAEGINGGIIKLWYNLEGLFVSDGEERKVTSSPLVLSLRFLSEYLDQELMFKNSDDEMPSWSQLFSRSCMLMEKTVFELQRTGYQTLMRMVNGLMELDSDAVNSKIPSEGTLAFEQIRKCCVSTQSIVSEILKEQKVGEENYEVDLYSDAFNLILGYLLMWDVLFKLCEIAPRELKYQYAHLLKEEDTLNNLLENLMRLIPSKMLTNPKGERSSHCHKRIDFDDDHRTKGKDITILYERNLGEMACWIYSFSLLQFPTLVRQWWSGLEPKISKLVEKFTAVYASDYLFASEVTYLREHKSELKNVKLKILGDSQEIVAGYEVEEVQMDLTISKTPGFPLILPKVESSGFGKSVSEKPLLLQFEKCVFHENGRIWEGLLLWNNSLAKKFDGVEECYICFSVLHAGTYQLPKLSCRTCKKKFHSACLYKWFSTSNKSSCPICRNLF